MPEEKKTVRCTFGRHERLHSQKDFQLILKTGRRLVHPAFLIYIYFQRGASLCRLGLVTSRKVGTAVQRNRLKRRIREIFRLNKHRIKPGVEIVVILRNNGVRQEYKQLETAFLSLLQRAGAMLPAVS
jgi:ribonuclease P protein component